MPTKMAADDAENYSKKYGVTEYHEVSALPEKHKLIIRTTLEHIFKIGRSEADHEEALKKKEPNKEFKSAYLENIHRREPIFSFSIDGPRGSGKTSLTLTIRYFASCLCQKHYTKDLTEGLTELLGGPRSTNSIPFDYLTPLNGQHGSRRLVLALPLLRPDHMETSETIMEGVFAQMSELLDQEIGHAKGNRDEKRISEALELKSVLHSRIAKGWYFSRRMGVEALLNDSLNFDEYIERRSEEATWSHTRMKRWREYVIDYLQFFDAQLLGIFLDDTDVANQLTVDLLHSIRMYFCHPRIVTVVAGNMHTMRQRLLQEAIAHLHKTSQMLRSPDSFTASFWRKFERENIEEYLEKVFPRPFRQFIDTRQKELTELLDGQTFSQYCVDRMHQRLTTVLGLRKETCRAHRDAVSHMYHSIASEHEVENYLSLWLLKNHYQRSLAPTTARHLNQFISTLDNPQGPGRRVAVALFKDPRNFELLQRFTDRDREVIKWLSQQKVKADWRTPAQVQINQLTLPFGSPSLEFLLFRTDLEFARPTYAQNNAEFAAALLPRVSGHNTSAPEVWETSDRSVQAAFVQTLGTIVKLNNKVLRLRQELYGLASYFNSAVIPANCLYFKDLKGLPDVMWKPNRRSAEADSPWAAWDELPAEDIDILFDLDRYDTRSAYFRDVITVFGSYPLPKPIPLRQYQDQLVDLLELEDCSLAAWDPSLRELQAKDVVKFPHWARDFKYDRAGRDTWPMLWTVQASRDWDLINRWFASVRFFYGLQRPLSDLYQGVAAERDGSEPASASADVADGETKRAGPHATNIVKKLTRIAYVRAALEVGDESLSEWLEQQLSAFEHSKGKDSGEPDPLLRNFGRASGLFFKNVVPRYHRILCDVRRAHAALRILENDLNDYAATVEMPSERKETPTEAGENLAERYSPALFNHKKADKIRLVGLHKLRCVLGLRGIRTERSEDDPGVRAEKTYDARYFIEPKEKLSPGSNATAEYLAEFRTDESISIVKLHAHFARRDPLELLDCRTPQAGDPRRHIERMVRRASHMRSTLLFLWGMGPTLTSLIHLEVMGECYWWENEYKTDARLLSDQARKARVIYATDLIDKWIQTVAFAGYYALTVAHLLELNIGRQIEACGSYDEANSFTDIAGPFEANREAFTPFPDFSISTLGLRLFSSDRKKVTYEKDASYEGIIGDILVRLQLALWYLGKLRAWINNGALAPPPPLPAPAHSYR